MTEPGQNPEPQGVTAKIFRSKDLVSSLEPLRGLGAKNFLEEPSRTERVLHFSAFSVKVVRHRNWDFSLWKAVEKGRQDARVFWAPTVLVMPARSKAWPTAIV